MDVQRTRGVDGRGTVGLLVARSDERYLNILGALGILRFFEPHFYSVLAPVAPPTVESCKRILEVVTRLSPTLSGIIPLVAIVVNERVNRISATSFAVLAVWAAPLTLNAQSLDDARRHYLSAEFEEAIEGFDAVLASPSLTRVDAVEAHRYLVALRQLLGDEAMARRHAEAALALDPSAAAPEGSAPEVLARFQEARASLGGERATLTVGAPDGVDAGESATVVARLAPAPEGMATRLHLRCASGTSVAEERAAPPEVRVDILVDGDSVLCRAAALTVAGASILNERVELGLQREAMVADGSAVGGGGDDVAIWVGVVSAVVALGVGAAVLAYFLTQEEAEQAMLGTPTVVGW